MIDPGEMPDRLTVNGVEYIRATGGVVIGADVPMQPLVLQDGCVRFRTNTLVQYLLDHGPVDMNRLARLNAPRSDRAQFAQLIGYSVSGYGSLSYALNVDEADRAARELLMACDAGGVTEHGHKVAT